MVLPMMFCGFFERIKIVDFERAVLSRRGACTNTCLRLDWMNNLFLVWFMKFVNETCLIVIISPCVGASTDIVRTELFAPAGGFPIRTPTQAFLYHGRKLLYFRQLFEHESTRENYSRARAREGSAAVGDGDADTRRAAPN